MAPVRSLHATRPDFEVCLLWWILSACPRSCSPSSTMSWTTVDSGHALGSHADWHRSEIHGMPLQSLHCAVTNITCLHRFASTCHAISADSHAHLGSVCALSWHIEAFVALRLGHTDIRPVCSVTSCSTIWSLDWLLYLCIAEDPMHSVWALLSSRWTWSSSFQGPCLWWWICCSFSEADCWHSWTRSPCRHRMFRMWLDLCLAFDFWCPSKTASCSSSSSWPVSNCSAALNFACLLSQWPCWWRKTRTARWEMPSREWPTCSRRRRQRAPQQTSSSATKVKDPKDQSQLRPTIQATCCSFWSGQWSA